MTDLTPDQLAAVLAVVEEYRPGGYRPPMKYRNDLMRALTAHFAQPDPAPDFRQSPIQSTDYYEDDEDPTEIHRLFDEGEKGVTASPLTSSTASTTTVTKVFGVPAPERPSEPAADNLDRKRGGYTTSVEMDDLPIVPSGPAPGADQPQPAAAPDDWWVAAHEAGRAKGFHAGVQAARDKVLAIISADCMAWPASSSRERLALDVLHQTIRAAFDNWQPDPAPKDGE